MTIDFMQFGARVPVAMSGQIKRDVREGIFSAALFVGDKPVKTLVKLSEKELAQLGPSASPFKEVDAIRHHVERYYVAGLGLPDLKSVDITNIDQLSALHSVSQSGRIDFIHFAKDKKVFALRLTQMVKEIIQHDPHLVKLVDLKWPIFEIEHPLADVPNQAYLRFTGMKVAYSKLEEQFKKISREGLNHLDGPKKVR